MAINEDRQLTLTKIMQAKKVFGKIRAGIFFKPGKYEEINFRRMGVIRRVCRR